MSLCTIIMFPSMFTFLFIFGTSRLNLSFCLSVCVYIQRIQKDNFSEPLLLVGLLLGNDRSLHSRTLRYRGFSLVLRTLCTDLGLVSVLYIPYSDFVEQYGISFPELSLHESTVQLLEG